MMKDHPILGETQGRQDARMQEGLDGPQVRSLLNAVRGGEVRAGDDGPQLSLATTTFRSNQRGIP